MLRCPKCQAEGEFEVDEVSHRTVLVQVDSSEPWAYLEKETLAIWNMDWDKIVCSSCQFVTDYHDATLAYDQANMEEETDHAPDVTPQPDPLAQP